MSPSHRLRSTYDAVVVGARCAGAATAMLLARHGLRVLAIERSREGSDTLSTHALMRAGVLQLARWGLVTELEAAGTPAVRTTTFHYREESLPIAIRPRPGVDALYAPRRTLLDRLLAQAAREAGAQVEHRTRMLELLRSGDGRVRGVRLEHPHLGELRIEADLVIGADGLRSAVAREVGAPVERSGRHAAGFLYGYWSGIEVDGYHWHYRTGVSAGAIPTNDGLTCVFVAVPEQRFSRELRGDRDTGYRRVLQECAPELAAQVEKGRRIGHLRGFPGSPGFLRRPSGPGWALVGDAGYFRDPLTAHGITDALRDAELLARAVVAGDDRLADYAGERDRLAAPFLDASDRIASFAWDLDEVKQLHLKISEEMKREVALLEQLDDSRPSSLPDRAA